MSDQIEQQFNLYGNQLDQPLNLQDLILQQKKQSDHNTITQIFYQSETEEQGDSFRQKQDLTYDSVNFEICPQPLQVSSEESRDKEVDSSKHCDELQYRKEYQKIIVQHFSSIRSKNIPKKLLPKKKRSVNQRSEIIQKQIIFFQNIIYQKVKKYDALLRTQLLTKFDELTQNYFTFFYQNIHLLDRVLFGYNNFNEQVKKDNIANSHSPYYKILQCLYANNLVEPIIEVYYKEFKRCIQFLKEQQQNYQRPKLFTKGKSHCKKLQYYLQNKKKSNAKGGL